MTWRVTGGPVGFAHPCGGSRLLLLGAVAFVLATGVARADGLGFVGDLPDAQHVLIDLTEAQRQEIARSPRSDKRRPLPEIQLTRAQQGVLRESTGAEVRWLFVARKEWLAGDCACGTYNLGVVVGRRLAVLQMGLGDHLGARDLVAMERDLVDPSLRVDARGPSPALVRYPWRWGDVPEPLRGLAARFPGESFDRRLALGGGWKAQRVRLAALPVASDLLGAEDVAARLHTLSAVSARPAAGAAIDWPRLGARLEANGRVYLLLPGLGEGEIGPKARVWFILEYQGGRLTSAAARSESGWTGATYEWPGAGP